MINKNNGALFTGVLIYLMLFPFISYLKALAALALFYFLSMVFVQYLVSVVILFRLYHLCNQLAPLFEMTYPTTPTVESWNIKLHFPNAVWLVAKKAMEACETPGQLQYVQTEEVLNFNWS